MSITSRLFWLARRSADLRAISKGPAAVVKRQARKVVYRKTGGFIGGFLKGMGL